MIKEGNLLLKEMEAPDVTAVLEIQKSNNLYGWNSADYLELIENSLIIKLVIKLEEKIIGFAVMRLIIFDKNNSDLLNLLTEGEIYNIAVRKPYSKKGIGTRLIKALIQNGKSYSLKNIWLEVRESNQTAINFYRKNSFEEVYRRKNYYTSPQEDAIIMRLDLTKP